MSHRLFLTISELYNFRVHVIRTQSWGYLQEDNRSWSGQMGTLQRHDADLASGPLLFVPLRQSIADSSLPVARYRQFFVFRHPVNFDVKQVFLKPLEPKVWICILLLSALTALCLYTLTVPGPWFTVIATLSQQAADEEETIKFKIILFFTS